MDDVGRYRYRVFVSHLGWPLRSSDGRESDEFDGPEAIYVTSQDDQGEINGVARLLPTTTPYLLEKVFPTLWGGPELPRNGEVWELSRFAAVDFNGGASLANQASAAHAAGLFRYVASVAKKSGARTLITVSPVGMERLLRVNNFEAARAGIPLKIDEGFIVALKINLDKGFE